MPTEISANLTENALWRVLHLLRPAEGGMRAQAAALLQTAPEGSTLLAAPPDVIHALGNTGCTFSLPAKIGGLKQQARVGLAAGKWARRNGATLLHGHGLRWLPLYAVAGFWARLPLVITLHNIVPSLQKMTGQERLALQIGLGRAARIIAVSRAVAESAVAVVPQSKSRLCVIRNGVDLARFSRQRNGERRSVSRAALQLPDNATVLICVARLAPEKNLGTLLEAMARLTPPFPHLRLLLVGEGPWRPTLEHQARMLGITSRVYFTGVRTDIPDLLEASDLFCLPSRTEGLGIAAIEAMASGLPVVASRVGGLPEVVEDCVTGLLVAPGDTAALAQALATLLADPVRAAQMAKAGCVRANQLFDNQAMITATHAVYAELSRARRQK